MNKILLLLSFVISLSAASFAMNNIEGTGSPSHINFDRSIKKLRLSRKRFNVNNELTNLENNINIAMEGNNIINLENIDKNQNNNENFLHMLNLNL